MGIIFWCGVLVLTLNSDTHAHLVPKKTDAIRRITFPEGILALPPRATKGLPINRAALRPTSAKPSQIHDLPALKKYSKIEQSELKPDVKSVMVESGATLTSQTGLKYTKEDLDKIEV